MVYQLYPRSFADSNGDGLGDFEGIRSHLDHLRDLGVDAIWLSPCFPSPQRDHGYDVADYFDVEPVYGTLDDFDRMLAAGQGARHPHHARHRAQPLQLRPRVVPGGVEGRARLARARPLLVQATARARTATSRPTTGGRSSVGPAWTRVTEADGSPGQWYEHTFTPWQPDFNWYNPDVIDYFDRMLTFWFDRGVEGIRVHAVPVLGKHPDLPDQPQPPPGLTDGQMWRYNIYGHSTRPATTCGSVGGG